MMEVLDWIPTRGQWFFEFVQFNVLLLSVVLTFKANIVTNPPYLFLFKNNTKAARPDH